MKKIILLLLLLFLLLPLVSAQLDIESAAVCPAIQSITDKTSTTCLSIILWWALIALIFSELTKMVFHHNKSVAGIIAIIISLISVRFVPENLLSLSESMLFIILMIAGPPLLARFFTVPGGLRKLLTVVFYGAVAYFWLGADTISMLPGDLWSSYLYLWKTKPLEMGVGHFFGFIILGMLMRRWGWFRRSAAEVEENWRKQTQGWAKDNIRLTEGLKGKYGMKAVKAEEKANMRRWRKEGGRMGLGMFKAGKGIAGWISDKRKQKKQGKFTRSKPGPPHF